MQQLCFLRKADGEGSCLGSPLLVEEKVVLSVPVGDRERTFRSYGCFFAVLEITRTTIQ